MEHSTRRGRARKCLARSPMIPAYSRRDVDIQVGGFGKTEVRVYKHNEMGWGDRIGC